MSTIVADISKYAENTQYLLCLLLSTNVRLLHGCDCYGTCTAIVS